MNDQHHEQPIQGDELPTVDESFRVMDEQSANWVVRKIVEARRYADRVRVSQL